MTPEDVVTTEIPMDGNTLRGKIILTRRLSDKWLVRFQTVFVLNGVEHEIDGVIETCVDCSKARYVECLRERITKALCDPILKLVLNECANDVERREVP